MDKISIRYGESVTLPINVDDSSAVEATLFIGLPGQLPIITKIITITNSAGVFELDTTDTSIPLGSYKYQINVLDTNGALTKYPEPTDCDNCSDGDGFPDFVVYEALDVIEVS